MVHSLDKILPQRHSFSSPWDTSQSPRITRHSFSGTAASHANLTQLILSTNQINRQHLSQHLQDLSQLPVYNHVVTTLVNNHVDPRSQKNHFHSSLNDHENDSDSFSFIGSSGRCSPIIDFDRRYSSGSMDSNERRRGSLSSIDTSNGAPSEYSKYGSDICQCETNRSDRRKSDGIIPGMRPRSDQDRISWLIARKRNTISEGIGSLHSHRSHRWFGIRPLTWRESLQGCIGGIVACFSQFIPAPPRMLTTLEDRRYHAYRASHAAPCFSLKNTSTFHSAAVLHAITTPGRNRNAIESKFSSPTDSNVSSSDEHSSHDDDENPLNGDEHSSHDDDENPLNGDDHSSRDDNGLNGDEIHDDNQVNGD